MHALFMAEICRLCDGGVMELEWRSMETISIYENIDREYVSAILF